MRMRLSGFIVLYIGVTPTTTTLDAAPPNLLNIIRCKGTTGCSSGGCSCKKAGLHCSVMCKNCCGTACENSPEPDFNEEDTDDEYEPHSAQKDEKDSEEESVPPKKS